MKGFLGIKLSDKDYLPVLNLNDLSLKEIVLGKTPYEKNIKLDIYLNDDENFINPVPIGSFFLDNLDQDVENIEVYFKIKNKMLYVYAKANEIKYKSKFDLNLMKTRDLEYIKNDLELDIGSSNDFKNRFKIENIEVLDFKYIDDILIKNKKLQDSKNSYLLESEVEDGFVNLDGEFLNSNNSSVDKDFDEQINYFSDFSFEDENIEIDNKIVNESLNIHKNEELDSLDGSNKKDLSNNMSFSYSDDLNYDEDFDFDKIKVSNFLKDDEDLSVDDIIEDINSNIVNSVGFEKQIDKKNDFYSEKIEDIDSKSIKKVFMEYGMLYFSLLSLLLLVFFSFFLVFYKILRPKGFLSSIIMNENKIERYKKNYYG